MPKRPKSEDRTRIDSAKRAAQKGRDKRLKKGSNSKTYLIIFGIFIALCLYAVAEIVLNPKKPLSETPAIDTDKVMVHNSKSNVFFTQGLNSFWEEKSLADAKYIFQNSFSNTQQIDPCRVPPEVDIPSYFDARQKWPECVQDTYTQGRCAASHAIQAASSISERLCIAQKGEGENLKFSPQAILACSQPLEGKTPCDEGYLNESMDFALERGLPLEEDCPYNPLNLECTEGCKKQSVNVDNVCLMYGEENIKRQIMENGPVLGYFVPFTDVLPYSSGAYHMSDGIPFKGYQIVKIVGWDSTDIGGISGSWIIQNSWGQDWGENGFAKFLMNPQSDLGKFAYVAYPSPIVEKVVTKAVGQEEEINLDDGPVITPQVTSEKNEKQEQEAEAERLKKEQEAKKKEEEVRKEQEAKKKEEEELKKKQEEEKQKKEAEEKKKKEEAQKKEEEERKKKEEEQKKKEAEEKKRKAEEEKKKAEAEKKKKAEEEQKKKQQEEEKKKKEQEAKKKEEEQKKAKNAKKEEKAKGSKSNKKEGKKA